jgi:hypothetical protein
MSTYAVLDLFAGLGGFSSAFDESERWDVTTVEIDGKFDPDITADVMDLRPSDLLDTLGEYDYLVIVASPPCTVFSPAGNHDLWDMDAQEPTAPKSQAHVALAYHTIGLIQALAPDYWFVENPRGRMRWVLGQPKATVTYCQYGRDYMKPTDLWGEHPPMTYKNCGYARNCHKTNREDDGTSAVASMDSDHAKRSLVPYELSKAIRDACERAIDGDAPVQTTADQWLEAGGSP